MDNTGQISWLDYLIVSNPHGVMKVLNQNGFTGYLSPVNNQEMKEAAMVFIERDENDAVIALLKSHPLYDAILEIQSKEVAIPQNNFYNATGESVLQTLQTINYKLLIENGLIVIGSIFLAGELIKLVKGNVSL